MIFGSGDIGEDGVVVAFLDQTHGNTSNRALERNSGIEERQACAADRGHRRRAVGLKNVGDDPHRVGRLVDAGQNSRDGTLSQCAVAHFAAANAGHAAGFADAERREVVMQHEVLALLAFIAFQALTVVSRAQGSGDQSLRFAARKQCRTVRAGQNARLDADGANLVEGAAVRADAVFGDLLAEDALTEVLVVGSELLLGRRIISGQFGRELVLDLLDQRVAFGFAVGLSVERVLQTIADLGLQVVIVGLVELRCGKRALRLAGLGDQFVDGCNDLLDLFVGELDGCEDDLFGLFLCA